MYTIGIDTSTTTVGVAIHDGEDYVSFMEFQEAGDSVEWIARRMIEKPGVYYAVMDFINDEIMDFLIQTAAGITYGMTAGLPYNAITRAKHLAVHTSEIKV